MIRSLCRFSLAVLLSALQLFCAQTPSADRPPIMLPTSKMLTVPSPGRIGSTNSFPATMVLSPDGRYAALLNDGYGTQETLAHQSISVLDLKSNQIVEYPDARFGDEAHQSYFLGLAFSSDGKASLCLGRFADRSHRREDRRHRKRHCGLPLFRRQGRAGEIHSDCAAAAVDGEETRGWPEGAAPHGNSVSGRAGRDCRRGRDKLLIANNLSDNAVCSILRPGKFCRLSI